MDGDAPAWQASSGSTVVEPALPDAAPADVADPAPDAFSLQVEPHVHDDVEHAFGTAESVPGSSAFFAATGDAPMPALADVSATLVDVGGGAAGAAAQAFHPSPAESADESGRDAGAHSGVESGTHPGTHPGAHPGTGSGIEPEPAPAIAQGSLIPELLRDHAVHPIELVEAEPSAFLPYRDQDEVFAQPVAELPAGAVDQDDVHALANPEQGAPDDALDDVVAPPLAAAPMPVPERETFELAANETLPPGDEGVLRTGDTFDVRMLTDSKVGLQAPALQGSGLHETIDPVPRDSARGLGQPLFDTADDSLRARLARLELRDDLRQVLNQAPDLLRALVQQALGVLLQPESARSAHDWRPLVLDAWRRGNYEESLARTEAMARVAQGEQERVEAALQRGLVLEKLRRFPEALLAFEDASRGLANAAGGASPQVAEALLHRGLVLRREFQDLERTRVVLRTLVDNFGHRTSDACAGLVVRGLVNLALVESAADGDVGEALALYERVQRDFGGIDERQVQTSVAQAQFNRAVLLYERRQDVEGALAVYQQLADRAAGRVEADVALLVANALANQAWLLARKRQDIPAALATYRELDRRFGEQRDRDIALIVARGLFAAAALTAQELRAPRVAAELHAELARRYELFADAEFGLLVAKALFNLGSIRAAQPGGEVEAIAAYDSLVERCANREELAFGEWVAGALVNKAGIVARAGDVPRALETYWQVVREYGQRTEPAIAEQAAKALLNIGTLSGQAGDVDGAIAAFQEIGRRYATADDARVALIVARATGNLASLLANSRQDVDGALRTFGELVSRIGNRSEPEFIEQGARALFSMGVLLGGVRKDPDGAIATYDVLAQRYGNRTEPGVVQQVVKGLFNQAALQAREQRDLHSALHTLDALLARYADVEDPAVTERIVSAMLNKARIERLSGHRDRAHATFERVVQRFGLHDEPQIRKHVDAARRALGEGLAA
jgi:tetratricopeptide (TPR) repeat protein